MNQLISLEEFFTNTFLLYQNLFSTTTQSSTHIYERIGAAAGCVLGNAITGIMTIVLLQLSQLPPTSAIYAIYVTVMYLGFPMTVLSQLSTGPMLDRIAPANQKGFVQGLNTVSMYSLLVGRLPD